MKHARPRGEAIDGSRLRSWRENFQSYRHTINDNSIDRWLEQFRPADKDLAARILDVIEFISSEQISSAFRQILAQLPGWHTDKKRRVGQWRFVPFSRSSGESGDSMVHKFRHANNLASAKYSELFVYRSELMDLTEKDTVVFIDDFSGTGNQVTDSWERLHEYVPGGPLIYLVLVGVNSKAREKIQAETDLQVVSHFDYGESDNLFSGRCRQFTPLEKERILEYCTRADRFEPRGKGDCGMVLIFSHNSPNNSIPILHKFNARWEGLFRRYD
jgi:hypothetical protein